MKATVLSRKVEFPPWYYYYKTIHPPSKKMIYTLRCCRSLEVANPMSPYGPTDISGSLNGLLNRDLIGIKKIIMHGSITWFVTDKGKRLLKQIA